MPAPWVDAKASTSRARKPLRVGWYVYDGWCHVSPLCSRAVHDAVAELSAGGHTCVHFAIDDLIHDAVETFCGLTYVSTPLIAEALRGEKSSSPDVRRAAAVGRLPSWLKRVLAWAKGRSSPKTAALLRAGSVRTAQERALLEVRRASIARAFFARMREHDLDAVVCPPCPLPAVPHGRFFEVQAMQSYAVLYNLIGAPAGVVPVAQMRRPEDAEWPGPAPKDAVDEAIRDTYAQAVAADVAWPAGVQVVGRPFDEETVLRVMVDVEESFARRSPRDGAESGGRETNNHGK